MCNNCLFLYGLICNFLNLINRKIENVCYKVEQYSKTFSFETLLFQACNSNEYVY